MSIGTKIIIYQRWRLGDLPGRSLQLLRGSSPRQAKCCSLWRTLLEGLKWQVKCASLENWPPLPAKPNSVSVQLIFNPDGKRAEGVLASRTRELIDNGFTVFVPDQAASAYLVS